VVIQEGETGDSFFAIGAGQVDVFEQEALLRTLGPGAYFGEVALLLDIPRTATVVAKTPVRLYRLRREGFDRVVARAFKKGTLNPWRAIDRTAQH
jgi:CRP-like cAMP-binding protein